MLHDLKSWNWVYDDVIAGHKRFEIRNNDRDFQAGDHVVFHKVDEQGNKTGDISNVYLIDYILPAQQFPEGITPGYCVFSITSPSQKATEGTGEASPVRPETNGKAESGGGE